MPQDNLARSPGVVLCPPFGYEYTHSHRSFLHLADDLAAEGFVALRLDYFGTGDSEGDAWTPDLLERWVGSVVEAIGQLSALMGGRPPAVLGLRFGALLAGLAAERTDVRHFVAWHPVSSGKRYVREHEALQRMAGGTGSERPDPVEAGGFVLTRASLEEVERVDLREARLRVLGQALVLDRDDLGPEARLAEHLAGQGIPTRARPVPGYLGMMAEPQYTVVPREAIRTIVTWLDEVSEKKRDMQLGEAEFSGLPLQPSAEWDIGGVRVAEELAEIPAYRERGLFGVLTVPTRGLDSGSGTVVILANSGSVHHVGPNRLYVELARVLAREGVASLRLDLHNLGDSRLGESPDENYPYPAAAVADVRAAIEWLVTERAFSRCILAGLCSGAHTAFHAGLELESHPIAGVICINPLTFQWQDGMSLDTPDTHRTTRDAQYYSGAVRNWSKWKKLLSGQANLGYIARFAVSRARDVLGLHLRHGAERAHLRAPGLLGQRLERYRASGRALRFVFSTRDPGHAILMSEAGPTVGRLLTRGGIGIAFVEDADHTFSRDVWRRRASEAVAEAVRATTLPVDGTLVNQTTGAAPSPRA